MCNTVGVGYSHFDVVETIGNGHILNNVTGMQDILKEGKKGSLAYYMYHNKYYLFNNIINSCIFVAGLGL